MPALAYDIGFLLIRECQFHAALSVLERTVPLIQRPEERALVWSAVAWAAAGASLGERFEEAERVTAEQVAIYDDFAPAIFIHLADACRALRRWDRALAYVKAAHRSAVERQEPPLAREAEELWTAIERRQDAPAQAEESVRAGALARAAVLRLQKWAQTPGRGRPGADSEN